jgi:DNA-binding beta-propeller fold protein YncE
MAKKPDGKPASVDRVSFTRPAAERIGRAVRQVEAGDRDLGPIEWGPRGGGAASKVFRVCTFTGAWSINTAKTVTFRNVTSTPNTVSATNLFCDLPSNGELACAVAKAGTAWYLVQSQFTSVSVITGATLGTAGLTFTRALVRVPSTAAAASITVGTTGCT